MIIIKFITSNMQWPSPSSYQKYTLSGRLQAEPWNVFFQTSRPPCFPCWCCFLPCLFFVFKENSSTVLFTFISSRAALTVWLGLQSRHLPSSVFTFISSRAAQTVWLGLQSRHLPSSVFTFLSSRAVPTVWLNIGFHNIHLPAGSELS